MTLIDITQKEFIQLTSYIKQRYGIHLREEKRTLVMGRLQQVLLQHKFRSFSEYYDYVVTDRTGRAAATLIDKISTNHTYFMRETKHFDFFRHHMLPECMNQSRDRHIRIWSAGCSSGEEPYTLAMILHDVLGFEKLSWTKQILATDISSIAITKAERGIYRNEAVAVLPESWRRRYLHKYDEEHMIVADMLKKDVVVRMFNLMDKVFPFNKKFHAIFCRNVMIYFDHETKMELVNKFYHALEPGGYLFIGHSESLDRSRTNFQYVMPAVYRKETTRA